MPQHRADRSDASRRGSVDAAPAVASHTVASHTVASHRASHRAERAPHAGLLSRRATIGAATLALAAAGTVAVSTAHARPARSAASSTNVAHVVVTQEAARRDAALSRSSDREAVDSLGQKVKAASRLAKQGDPVVLKAARKAARVKRAAREEKRAAARRAVAWQLPVTPGVYHLTAGFGACSGLWSHCHTGLDFAAPSGTPIHAIAAGTIVSTEYAGSYGNQTIMKLADGTTLWYCHQTSFLVHPGETVRPGQEIGTVGSTGNTTGPHVHVEVHPGGGDPVDPYTVLVAHGLKP